MKKTTYSRRGQTLVEAIIALSILTTGFLGILTLLTKSFQLNRFTSNDTQASYLAAEGIEVTKSIIDHDVYLGLAQGTKNWDASFAVSGYYHHIDYTTTSTAGISVTPSSPDNDPLYIDPSTGLYSYNTFGTTQTHFIRNIKITNMNVVAGQPQMIDVQSTVKWTSGVLSNSITLEDQFYDWHP